MDESLRGDRIPLRTPSCNLSALGMLAVALVACASSRTVPGQPHGGMPQAEPMRLLLQYTLDVGERPSPSNILEVDRAAPYDAQEVLDRLDGIMRHLTAAVADSLSASPSVRWVVTQPSPHLSPDHALLLTLRELAWVAGREEETTVPQVRVHVTLTSVPDASLLLSKDTHATGKELYLRRPADLDLRSLYLSASRQICLFRRS